MATKKEVKRIKESRGWEPIHVFGKMYLGYDELNMIIMKKNISKTKKINFVNIGYYISGKALLSRLYDMYLMERLKDKTIVKPEILIGIESFVNKVEKIKAEFDEVSRWK